MKAHPADLTWQCEMDGNQLGRIGVLIYTIILILVFADKAFAQSSTEDDIHISAIAEFYTIHRYSNLEGHKALAVGPGGFWWSSFRKSSAEAASQAALKGCNAALQRSSYKRLAKRHCVLFDIDGNRTGKATPIGNPFGTAAQGPDRPYEGGGKWEPTVMPRRGNLLLLGGCNKVKGTSGWIRSWINFYRASGFRVIRPDSFNEPRDHATCGEDGTDAQTRNLKLRVAQALRTIATLRRKYPGEPIYVHGHSEGGYAAQALGEKLNGVIVTGGSCGFGAARTYWLGEGTPLLVIAGTKDWRKTAGEVLAYCNTVRGEGKLKTVAVTGMGHLAALWWPEVRDAVTTFLDVEPISVARREAAGLNISDIPPKYLEQYKNYPNPKALAADEKGRWSWSVNNNARYKNAETTFDAEEHALFDCDERAGTDAFLDPSHRHTCVLIDVNGERLVK